MEGVVDSIVRDLWTELGGFDRCTTEFIRVTSQLLPPHVFYRFCPELHHGSRTRVGTPVYVQILGGDSNCVAENAARACELGAIGIDLNFGCPAPTVNRHDGGAALLQYPERIHDITSKTRRSMPSEIPLTAKMRLGLNDTALCLENAQAASTAGIASLTVHCRTKLDFYRPPARWEWLDRIADVVTVPIIANGEIWTVEDWQSLHSRHPCAGYMLGRGALSDPFLASRIHAKFRTGLEAGSMTVDGANIQDSEIALAELLHRFVHQNLTTRGDSYAAKRCKQLLRYLSRKFSMASLLFDEVKTQNSGVVIAERFGQTQKANR